MRLKVEINDLTPEQWRQAQRLLKTEYTIPDGASRVCLTLVHGDELMHVETPVSAFTSLMWGMSLASVFKGLNQSTKVAMAALTPDDDRLPWPDGEPEEDRLPGEPCDHGSPVVKTDPSAFDDAPPVRTHEDGCQSYGPYATGSDT